MHRRIYFWLCVTVIALLSGCTGNQIKRSATISELNQKSIAIFSISHDSTVGNGANAIFYLDESRYPGRVVMKSVQDNLSIPVKSEFTTRRGHLYILEIAPGDHTIDAWQVASAGARYSSKIEPMRFSIRSGEVLYLGNLHAELVKGHGLLTDGYAAYGAAPFVFDRHDEDIALAESRVPALAGKVKTALLPLGPLKSTSAPTKRIDPLPMVIVPKK